MAISVMSRFFRGLHPFLLSGAYVINAAVAAGPNPALIVRSLLVALVATAIVVVLATAITRSSTRGAVIATGLIILILIPDPISLALTAFFLMPPWVQASWLAAMLAAAYLALRVGLKLTRGSDRWQKISSALNLAMAMLALVVAAGALAHLWQRPNSAAAAGAATAVQERTVAAADAPDIFVLLLDGYARADTLERLMDFDNRPFLTELTDRGFAISPCSRSNYAATAHTLASMFQMRLLRDVPAADAVFAKTKENRPLLRDALNDSPFLAELSASGYRTAAISSGMADVEIRSVDTFIDTGEVNEFEFQLVRPTAIPAILQAVAPDWMSGQQRSRVTNGFRELTELAAASTPEPQFVFAHILSPHPPFVFGPNGEPRRASSITNFYDDAESAVANRTAYIDGYREQVHHLNQLVLQAVDDILATSDSEPVIIIMSDHGSASHWLYADRAHSDPDERHTNLFAALTPGEPDLFGPSVTPVNVLTMIANSYLRATISNTADRTFDRYREEVANPDAGGGRDPADLAACVRAGSG